MDISPWGYFVPIYFSKSEGIRALRSMVDVTIQIWEIIQMKIVDKSMVYLV